MRIFEDMFTGTQVISDSYPMTLLFDGAACEVQSRMVVQGDVNVDVGCGNAFGGKNEEDEEEGAGNAPPVAKVNDLIDSFGYVEAGYDKPQWAAYIKGYIKELLQKKTQAGVSADQIAKFKANAGLFVKHIQTKFADLTIYTPKDGDFEHSLIYSYWKNEDDEAPIFIFYLDGCKGVKV